MVHKITKEDINKYWKDEFYDLLLPFVYGEKKHGELNWETKNGSTCSHKKNAASMFRHLAEHSSGHDIIHDAPYDPLLAVACRALMQYYRKKHGIIHDDDVNVEPYRRYNK